MKRLLPLLACPVLLAAADLTSAHTVYILSMSRGLDQYLANRLINNHVFHVVTDPKLADVIFTDHLGEAFQAQLEKISPTPEEPAPPPKPEPKAAKPDPKAAKADDTDAGITLIVPPVNKLENPALASTFGRNKGTFFLVDAKSREVLWSVYDPPHASSGRDMDRTASDIVSRLKKDLGRK